MTTYKNTTTYQKQHFDTTGNSYTRFPNYILRDPELLAYPEAKLIMLYLLSNDKTFIVNKQSMQKVSGIGRRRFNKAWTKLEELGYIIKSRLHRGWHWDISDNPNELEDWKGHVAEEVAVYLKRSLY